MLKRLIVLVFVIPCVSLAKPKADSREAWLETSKISLTTSKDFMGGAEWVTKGSSYVKGEKGPRIYGVAMISPTVSKSWQERIVACHMLGMLEAKKVLDVTAAALMKDYQDKTTKTDSVMTENISALKQVTSGEWGEPPFKLMGLNKSYSGTTDGKTEDLVSTAAKITLPAAIWGGAAVKYYASSQVIEGQPPKEELSFQPGIPDVTTAKLTELHAYFTKAGMVLRGVNDFPDSMACLVELSLDAKTPGLSDEQKKVVRENADKVLEEK